MLRDVDASLMAWLPAFLPPDAVIALDAPTGHTGLEPTLGLYLHDVREEAEITPADWTGVRGDDGRLVGRLGPQRRYRLTYLVTAWAASTLDEHEMLGNILAGCALSHTIPTEYLHGCLVETGQALMVRCAPLDRACDPRELWGAWHLPPRTALELSVLAPLPAALVTSLAPPPRDIALSSSRPPGGERTFGRPAAPDGNGRPPGADGEPRLGRARATIEE